MKETVQRDAAPGVTDLPALSAPASGAIAYRLRVGVTGHRSLPDDGRLAERVRDVLQRVQQMGPSSSATPLRLVVVSPLAEGADQLVANEALQMPGTALVVPLPLPADDYLADFIAEESRRAFARLSARAQETVTLPPVDARDNAFQEVGEYVLDHCDVLIALWDGQPARGPGGTAEVVARARARGIPLFWIQTTDPFAVREEAGAGITERMFRHLDAFNRDHISAARIARHVTRRTAALCAEAERTGLDPALLRPFCAWNLPSFVRADLLAQQYQRLFLRVSTVILLLAAVSAMTITGQELFFPGWPQVQWLEVLLMVTALAILLLNRRWRLHERWSAYRLLAEWLRTRLFVALAGVSESAERTDRTVSPADDWLGRACDEVWQQRPQQDLPESLAEPLKRFLVAAWIDEQIAYQGTMSGRLQRRHRQLTYAIVAIFGITLLAALLNVLGATGHGLIHTSRAGAGLTFLSTALPALAGALSGMVAQREYQHHARRYGRTGRDLERIKRRLERCHSLGHIRSIAQQAEALILSENGDWFSLMQFHDIDLPV